MRRYKHFPKGILAALLAAVLLGAAFAEEPPGDSKAPAAAASPEETVKPEPFPEWEIRAGVLIACRNPAAVVTVPDGIREIAPHAFQGLRNLEKVILPDSVTLINEEAFTNCERLQEIVLSPESRLAEIRERAFLDCPLLKRDFIPAGAAVAENAFAQTEPATPTPGGGGGGGYSGPRQPHARNTVPAGPEYDHLALDAAETQEPMTRLTLGGVELELSLSGPGGGRFTVSAMHWRLTDRDEGTAPNTLLLTAEESGEGQKCIWRLNGSVLRQMNKSGIEILALRTGERIVAMDTGGFLAGWEWDELKSRGTGSRRFDYEITMDGGAAVWRLKVEGQEYSLGADLHAGLYLNRVFSGSAEALNAPLDTLFPREDS